MARALRPKERRLGVDRLEVWESSVLPDSFMLSSLATVIILAMRMLERLTQTHVELGQRGTIH